MNQWIANSLMPDKNPKMQRRILYGNKTIKLSLNPKDKVVICDPEGLQQAYIYILNSSLENFELPLDIGEMPLSQIIKIEGKQDLLPFIALDDKHDANEIYEFTAPCELELLICAYGKDMLPFEQTPPTPIEIYFPKSAQDLPEPLAEIKAEYRIKAGTAISYEVEEGDYIQIVDVEGKQCSDLLAFDKEALALGQEKGLDPTVTRTLMGNSYPTPGLHSKYFNEDFKALIELYQDTVGRHDTFAVACSAKYYNDMGYMGHDNCSENFNKVLADYPIKPRNGWPAINFFYNTIVTHDNQLGFDEPWSRAGDYVLLKALAPIVCASSSCADDIDAANGWNPTDIHIRIYDKSCNFSKGIANRMTPQAEPRLTRKSGFYNKISELTRYFVEYKGFWLPNSFNNEGAISEYWACRNHAAIMDLSPLRKFEVIGPDALKLLQYTQTRDMNKLAVGQVVYTAFCLETGGMIDDGTILRLCEHNFRIVVGDDYVGIWLREVAQKMGFKVFIKSSTDQLNNIAVQGPKSRNILSKIVTTPPHQPSIEELKWFRFTIGKIGEVPIMVSRTGYTGELGYEVWCNPKDAEFVWDAIYKVGEPIGMKPLGLLALDMLRIEAGLVFAGYDFCDQTDPVEAGIGFVIAKKEDDYIGKDAIMRKKENPAKKMVGLIIDSEEGIYHGDPVYKGRFQIGVVTSATKSPILNKNIALARLDIACSEIGEEVEIGKLDGQQKRIKATICAFPHFDPQKTRVRA